MSVKKAVSKKAIRKKPVKKAVVKNRKTTKTKSAKTIKNSASNKAGTASKKRTSKNTREISQTPVTISVHENNAEVLQHEKEYHAQAEMMNVLTHAVGLGLAIAGLAVLVYFSFMRQNEYLLVSSLIYGISMIFLFGSSVLYHATNDEKRKALFKKIDHIAIYIFIAGSYTPYLVRWFQDTTGQVMLTTVWSVAFAGSVLKLSNLKVKKIISALPYLVMGWMIIFIAGPSIEKVPSNVLVLFLGGGLAYTVGVVFYVRHKNYSHALWHVFVLAGVILHYAALIQVYG